mmetsp:Transcript_50669/g.120968  ORF Transcript_50669/g.120968 Transcript_50669/m.120968 type:complete len:344 (-) Transcript_50669:1900-2931(-)
MPQGCNCTAEGDQDENDGNHKLPDLGEHLAAHKNECSKLGREDRQVDHEQPVQNHGTHGEEYVQGHDSVGCFTSLTGSCCHDVWRTVEHRLTCTHGDEHAKQDEAQFGILIFQIFRDGHTSNFHGCSRAECFDNPAQVEDQKSCHTEGIVYQATTENCDPHVELLCCFSFRQNRLAKHEDDEAEQKAYLGECELSPDDARPQGVRNLHHHLVRDDLDILCIRDGLECSRKCTILGHDKVLHVEVHSPGTVDCALGAPNQSIKKCGQQLKGICTEPLHYVWMSLEKSINSEVIPLSISSYRQQVLDHCTRRLKTATLDGPRQWGDLLCADLDSQQPLGTLSTRS